MNTNVQILAAPERFDVISFLYSSSVRPWTNHSRKNGSDGSITGHSSEMILDTSFRGNGIAEIFAHVMSAESYWPQLKDKRSQIKQSPKHGILEVAKLVNEDKRKVHEVCRLSPLLTHS